MVSMPLWRYHAACAVASPAPIRHSVCSSQPGAMRRIEPAISGFPVRNCASEAWSFGPPRNDAVSILR